MEIITMDTSNKAQSHKKNNHADDKSAHVREAASTLLNEGKKLAHELYEENIDKVNKAHDHAKEYSDDLLEKVKENPLASILIAGGIGFLLSVILRK